MTRRIAPRDVSFRETARGGRIGHLHDIRPAIVQSSVATQVPSAKEAPENEGTSSGG